VPPNSVPPIGGAAVGVIALNSIGGINGKGGRIRKSFGKAAVYSLTLLLCIRAGVRLSIRTESVP